MIDTIQSDNLLQAWAQITIEAFQDLWVGFINFIPALLAALLIFIIGWIISSWIGKLITEILKRLRLDKLFETPKWQQVFEEAGFKISISEFFGGLIKWILVIVFLLITVQILGLKDFANFLTKIVNWLPNLIIATAIFVVAAVMAYYSEKVIKAIVSKMEIGYVNIIGISIRVAIWILAIFAILSQLGVMAELIEILASGIIALLVVSLGLAFGLGGKDLAKDLLENIRRKIKKD